MKSFTSHSNQLNELGPNFYQRKSLASRQGGANPTNKEHQAKQQHRTKLARLKYKYETDKRKAGTNQEIQQVRTSNRIAKAAEIKRFRRDMHKGSLIQGYEYDGEGEIMDESRIGDETKLIRIRKKQKKHSVVPRKSGKTPEDQYDYEMRQREGKPVNVPKNTKSLGERIVDRHQYLSLQQRLRVNKALDERLWVNPTHPKAPAQHGEALEENVSYWKNAKGDVGVVGKRPTKGMRGKQDQFSMYVTRNGKRIQDFGSHVTQQGAEKFLQKRGYTKKFNPPPTRWDPRITDEYEMVEGRKEDIEQWMKKNPGKVTKGTTRTSPGARTTWARGPKAKGKTPAEDRARAAHNKIRLDDDYEYDGNGEIREEGRKVKKHKVGDKVVTTKGPHKGKKHTVIHDHGDGRYNVRPDVVRNRYRLGAATAKGSELEPHKELGEERFRTAKTKSDKYDKIRREQGAAAAVAARELDGDNFASSDPPSLSQIAKEIKKSNEARKTISDLAKTTEKHGPGWASRKDEYTPDHGENLDELTKDATEYRKLMIKHGHKQITKIPTKDFDRIRKVGKKVNYSQQDWLAQRLKYKGRQVNPPPKPNLPSEYTPDHGETFSEARMGEIARNVRKGTAPYTIVALKTGRVVGQESTKIPNAVPAFVRTMQDTHKGAKISVEDRRGRVLHTEEYIPIEETLRRGAESRFGLPGLRNREKYKTVKGSKFPKRRKSIRVLPSRRRRRKKDIDDPELSAEEYVDEARGGTITILPSPNARGGNVKEVGKTKRGSRTEYYWQDKRGLKNVFDSLEKLRYSLRNTANFRDAERITAQLGEAVIDEADTWIPRGKRGGSPEYALVSPKKKSTKKKPVEVKLSAKRAKALKKSKAKIIDRTPDWAK